jgi:hypothetical protein
VALAEGLGARVLFLNLPYQPDKTAKPRVPEKGAGFFVVSADQNSPAIVAALPIWRGRGGGCLGVPFIYIQTPLRG